MRRLTTLLELLAVLMVLGVVLLLGLPAAVDGALWQASLRGSIHPELLPQRSEEAFRALASRGGAQWAGGIALLVLGRLLATRRAGEHLLAPLLLPAVATMSGLGLCLRFGYADPLHAKLLLAPDWAEGALIGGIIGLLILAPRRDPVELAVRGRWWILGLALSVFGLLRLSAPVNGAHITLFGLLQPIEGVKIALVFFLGAELGRHAAQLRYQRSGRWIPLPRPALLLGAVLAQAALTAGLFVVNDLGPTLILGLVFLGVYGMVTRSWVELAIVGALGLTALALAIAWPDLLPATIALRVRMLVDPWMNGDPRGLQLASSLWAMAAGGTQGQGLGMAAFATVPEGHSDLALANLTESLGLRGLLLYGAAMAAALWSAFSLGARNRTPERMLLAAGLGWLLLAQLLVIGFGTTGHLPLTGVVAPFLSAGRSGTVAFFALAALLLRLGAAGARARETDELRELRAGLRSGGALAALALLGLMGAFASRAVVERDRISLAFALQLNRDGTVRLASDPRLEEMAGRLRRGELLDLQGRPLAATDPASGARSWPLGDALGTVLGPFGAEVTLPGWSLERLHDARLRGLGEALAPRTAWVARTAQGSRVVHLQEGPPDETGRAEAQAKAGEGSVIATRLLGRDYKPLLGLLRQTPPDREPTLAALAADIPARSLRLSLDADLQRAASAALRTQLARRGLAGAAAVIDVDTGRVLARAQWPDLDPGAPEAWREDFLSADPETLGCYGPWRDKTGVGGFFQAGSVFKIFTGLAWLRSGAPTAGEGCATRGLETKSCRACPDGRGCFQAPGWGRAIHDAHGGGHGAMDLTDALEVSCNATFAQIGLELGPEPLRQLVADGLEVDWKGSFEPGPAGSFALASTAYGQGAARMNVLQAARMMAAVGAGGIYRRCPSDLRLDAPCEEHPLLADTAQAGALLSGLKRVVDEGTARRMPSFDGVRLYGKTGTATDEGRRDEAPYGIRQGAEATPHAWFVALAEPAGVEPCAIQAPGRLAVAVVLARAGYGGEAALPVAAEIIGAAREHGYFGDLSR